MVMHDMCAGHGARLPALRVPGAGVPEAAQRDRECPREPGQWRAEVIAGPPLKGLLEMGCSSLGESKERNGVCSSLSGRQRFMVGAMTMLCLCVMLSVVTPYERQGTTILAAAQGRQWFIAVEHGRLRRNPWSLIVPFEAFCAVGSTVLATAIGLVLMFSRRTNVWAKWMGIVASAAIGAMGFWVGIQAYRIVGGAWSRDARTRLWGVVPVLGYALVVFVTDRAPRRLVAVITAAAAVQVGFFMSMHNGVYRYARVFHFYRAAAVAVVILGIVYLLSFRRAGSCNEVLGSWIE